MKQNQSSDGLQRPRAPGLFPFDENGNAIYDRPTTKADWRKYWKALKRYKRKCRAAAEKRADERESYSD